MKKEEQVIELTNKLLSRMNTVHTRVLHEYDPRWSDEYKAACKELTKIAELLNKKETT